MKAFKIILPRENGIDYDEWAESEYGCNAFAGYSGIDDRYAASFADFGVLSPKNRYSDCRRDIFREKLYRIARGEAEQPFLLLNPQKLAALENLLANEIAEMKQLYGELSRCSAEIMEVHAPIQVKNKIRQIVNQTIFFRTVGLFGAMAVRTNALALPDACDQEPIAFYVYQTAEADKVMRDIKA